jgi:Mg2+-importing ATPase
MPKKKSDAYWNKPTKDLLAQLGSSEKGLSDTEAAKRLATVGHNTIAAREKSPGLHLLLNQFKNPLVLILLFATAVSFAVGESFGAAIILLIVVGSAVLSFVQEYSAANAMQKLRSRVSIKCTVLRGGKRKEIFADEIVPGDVVELSAGSIIPADGILLEENVLYVNQAALTGESFPQDKVVDAAPKAAGLAARTNCVFMGTNVQSGSGLALIVQTGRATAFGQIAEDIKKKTPETEFERGIRGFGNLLTRVMFILVIGAFLINVIFHRPILESLLFSIALAVGLTPELLPAIITVNLAGGAQAMAKKGVLVRRLTSIENLGSMDTLCADKTGTLTEGVLKLDSCLDLNGKESDEVFRLAYLNARFEAGWKNPLDVAIRAKRPAPKVTGVKKIEELPFDFERKRLTVILHDGKQIFLVTKGAVEGVLSVCTRAQFGKQAKLLTASSKKRIQRDFEGWSQKGYRVVAVATKNAVAKTKFSRKDENGMTLQGFLLFYDPPKTDAAKVVNSLAEVGVSLKVISGDHHLVVRHVAQMVGMESKQILTGAQIQRMSDRQLGQKVEECNLFAEVDPGQKERILAALHKKGHVLGYLGDGINDAPSLHAADVGISVEHAVDVAKDAADFVLLKSDLNVLKQGILLGRQTFANSMKYIFMTSSANFGNVFSMAGATLFLPFLPLLPFQILLTNFLTDIPALTLSGDQVDPELVARPRRWNIQFLRNYMLTFGFISSLFDYVTFAMLLLLLSASEVEFHTGWFIESVMTELFFLLIIRTRRPFFRSKPGRWLVISTILVVILTLAFSFIPALSVAFAFIPLPGNLAIGLLVISVMFLVTTELAKALFYRFEARVDEQA